jgi:hypothetical protein
LGFIIKTGVDTYPHSPGAQAMPYRVTDTRENIQL